MEADYSERMSIDTLFRSSVIVLVLFSALSCSSVQVEAQLTVGFYRETCQSAERIVREEVVKAFMKDNGIAPGLVRMHFHDCFVRVSRKPLQMLSLLR